MFFAVASILGPLAAYLTNFIYSYGYIAIFVLMTLEYASLPIPSEVVLPLSGLLVAKGVFNPFAVFFVTLFAAVVGMAIDYYIADFIGKDVVYKHLGKLRMKKESVEAFDSWFSRNGAFAVFICRLIPEIRGLVSLPAGFAAMPKRKFFAYSVAGAVIWNVALISFGYFALNVTNAYVILGSIAVFAIVLYLIYVVARKRMMKG